MPENTSRFPAASTSELVYDALVAEGNQDQADLLTGDAKNVTKQNYIDFINGNNRKSRSPDLEVKLLNLIQDRLTKRQRILPWKKEELYSTDRINFDPEKELVYDALADEGNLDQAELLKDGAETLTKADFIDLLNSPKKWTEELEKVKREIRRIRVLKDQRVFPWPKEEVLPQIIPAPDNIGGGAW